MRLRRIKLPSYGMKFYIERIGCKQFALWRSLNVFYYVLAYTRIYKGTSLLTRYTRFEHNVNFNILGLAQ